MMSSKYKMELICSNLFLASMFDSIPGYEGTAPAGGGKKHKTILSTVNFSLLYIIKLVIISHYFIIIARINWTSII